MPRSIIVVSTVPGTVATIQLFVSKPGAEICSACAFTSGAAVSRQFAAIVHRLSPDRSSVSLAGPSGLATGFEKAAFVCGRVEGSCGSK